MMDSEELPLSFVWQLRDGHIPAYIRGGYGDYIPSDEHRAQAALVAQAVPIWDSFVLPGWFRELPKLERLMIGAMAVLRALEALGYRFSLVGGRIVLSKKATVIVTATRDDGVSVAKCPWSTGESAVTVAHRLIECKRRGPLRYSAVESFTMAYYLPRPAAVVSVTPALNGVTNLLASGGECSIAVAFAAAHCSIAMDHRIYDGGHQSLLSSAVIDELEAEHEADTDHDGHPRDDGAPVESEGSQGDGR